MTCLFALYLSKQRLEDMENEINTFFLDDKLTSFLNRIYKLQKCDHKKYYLVLCEDNND